MLRDMLFATAAVVALTIGAPAMAQQAQDAGNEATPQQGTMGTAAEGSQSVVDDATPAQADMMGDTSAIQDMEVGQDSELAGSRYRDLEGRSVYTREGTELGQVRNARVNERGEVDAVIVAGGEGLGDQVLLIPVNMISTAQGGEAVLTADVGDADIQRMRDQRQGMQGGSEIDPDVREALPEQPGSGSQGSGTTQ